MRIQLSAEAAALILKNYEARLKTTDNSEQKFYLVTRLAPVAYSAGDMYKARSYSIGLLGMAGDFRADWNYGNAIHIGNLVLGRIALGSGDVAEAKRYLLESGKTIGSPQLNSFGPNMTLAKELLERGERQVVLDYFKLCAVFWKMENERLNICYGTAYRLDLDPPK